MDRGIGDADAHSCNDRLATASFTCGESHFSKSPFANGTSAHCCGRITARIAIEVYVVAAARAAEVEARRGGFGGRGGVVRPKRRFVNPSANADDPCRGRPGDRALGGLPGFSAAKPSSAVSKVITSGQRLSAAFQRRLRSQLWAKSSSP